MTSFSYYTHKTGFSLLQLVIAVAIVTALSVIIFSSTGTAKTNQLLKNETEGVVAVIKEAQEKTLSGEGDSQYGVHIQSDKVVLFTGSSYSSSASSNRAFTLDSTVTITSISLAGGGSDIVFSQLSGETSQYGTFVIKNISTTNGQKTITVSKLGLVTGN